MSKREIITPVGSIMARNATRARPVARKRRNIKKRGGRRRKGGKKAGLNPSNQRAIIVETLDAGNLVADQPYQGTFNLAQFFRATTLAKNFQFYRANKVKYEYMPLYNTFQENNSIPAVAKPQIYFMMNRDQDISWSQRPPAQALFLMQSAGADPKPFVNNLEIVYKPNWCSPGLSAVTLDGSKDPAPVTSVVSLGLKKQFGWLATPDTDAYAQPNALNNLANSVVGSGYVTSSSANAGVLYNGHNFYISQYNEPAIPVARLVVTVEWEFKLGKNNYATFGQKAEVAGVTLPTE